MRVTKSWFFERRTFRATFRLIAVAWLSASSIGCGATINDYLIVAKTGNDASDWSHVRWAVSGIGTELHQRQAAGFEFDEGELAAVDFLRTVAREHRDAASRMVALSMLAKMRTEEANEDVFLETIEDPHFGVRWESSEALVVHSLPRCSEAIAKRVVAEPRIEVLVNLVKALGRIGDRTSLRVLLEVLLDASGRYRHNELSAHESVVAITGLTHAIENRGAWQEYYDREFSDPGTKSADDATPPDGVDSEDADPKRTEKTENEGSP